MVQRTVVNFVIGFTVLPFLAENPLTSRLANNGKLIISIATATAGT